MADSKATALTEVSVPDLADILYAVDDPAGTPVSVKISNHRLLGLLNHICQGRLTLATGYPVYNPLLATPSSTDTGTDTTTFAADHGWTTGTMVTPSATGGGLTAGTTYYLNAASSTTCTYHTTLANAEAASSKVDLTASITAEIRPYGVQSTTLRFAPYNGNLISVYDGTRWKLYAFTELSLALGTVTSGLPYDVFVYDNSGTLTLEILAWTNATTRATALTTQNGVYVKSGATTRRYLGTIYTVSTTATEDSFGGIVSQVGGKRFVWNLYNQTPRPLYVIDVNDTWTYSTAAFRQANAAGGNKVEVVVGLPGTLLTLACQGYFAHSSASPQVGTVGIGRDSTTANNVGVIMTPGINAAAAARAECRAECYEFVPAGYHYYAWLEYAGSTTTYTWTGDRGDSATRSQCGLIGTLLA